MTKSKIHVGQLYMTDRDPAAHVRRFHIVGNYELLLADGREIDPARYPKLAPLLTDNKLPAENQEEDICDFWVVARRLTADEIRFMKGLRSKSKKGGKE